MKYYHFLPLLLVFLGACTSAPNSNNLVAKSLPPVNTLIDTADFGPRPAIINAAQIFALSAAAQQHFLSYYNQSSRRKIRPHVRVFNYLKSSLGTFNYYSGTYTAQQTLDENNGNCLSLAILTTAYANLVNIETNYNEMTTDPIYSKDSQFEYESSHVVTKLLDPEFIPEDGVFYITKPQLVVDYFPTRNSWMGGRVSKAQFIAMFYRNLGAVALSEGQFNQAGWLLTESFKYAPQDLAGINLMAVLYRRMSHLNKAEHLYRYGLAMQQQNLILLSNYHLLLRSQGRTQEADKINIILEQADDPSPFRWLTLADEALAQGKLTRAEWYYEKTIEKAHYLPHGYAGAAKVAYLKGHKSTAKALLEMALQRTHDDKHERRYQAKLAALTMTP